MTAKTNQDRSGYDSFKNIYKPPNENRPGTEGFAPKQPATSNRRYATHVAYRNSMSRSRRNYSDIAFKIIAQ
jgi:hypothetical protein